MVFQQVALHPRLLGVKHAGGGVPAEVDGDQRQLVVGQHAPERPSAAAFMAAFTSAALTSRARVVCRSTTDTSSTGTRSDMPSSLPLSAGSTSPTALAAPVLVGMMEWVAGARAVHVAVGLVDQHLVVGVGVHRGHQPLHDAETVVQYLRHRRQAVGGAGGVGHQPVFGLQHVVVDAVHHRHVRRVGGGADQHLRAGGQVVLAVLAAGVSPRALEHDVDAERAPRSLSMSDSASSWMAGPSTTSVALQADIGPKRPWWNRIW